MISANDAADLLRDFGQDVVLVRLGNSPPDSVTVKATTPRVQTPEFLMPGALPQFTRRVVIGNTEITDASWPGPPRRGDQVIVRGRTMTVQFVNSAGVDETVIHDMTCVGQ